MRRDMIIRNIPTRRQILAENDSLRLELSVQRSHVERLKTSCNLVGALYVEAGKDADAWHARYYKLVDIAQLLATYAKRSKSEAAQQAVTALEAELGV